MRGPDGEWLRRFDMYYKRWRLLVEFDGRQHAEDEDQWTGDIYRREELDRRGDRLVVITKHGHLRRTRFAPSSGSAPPSSTVAPPTFPAASGRSGSATSRAGDDEPRDVLRTHGGQRSGTSA